MKQTIVSRWYSSKVLFECEVSEEIASSGLAMRHALEQAVKCGSNLSGSDLSGSNLSCSNLSCSNLRGSDLSGSNLSCSNLRGSNLSGSDLRGSNLRGSDLRGSNLRGSDLSGSNLSGSDLRGSDLRGSDLSGSDLRGSNLRGSNLRGSNLRHIKTDLFDVLLRAPREVAALRTALVDGKIDGSCYEGVCACLVGTIANARHETMENLGNGLKPNSSRPAEQWFLAIKPGDTPQTNQISALAVEWIDEFSALLTNASQVPALSTSSPPTSAR